MGNAQDSVGEIAAQAPRAVIAGFDVLAAAIAALFPDLALPQAGTLDPSFDTDGIAIFAPGTSHDVAGRLVVNLAEGVTRTAQHLVRWDGRDAGGEPVAAGCYHARLSAAGSEQTVKLMVTR